MEILGHGIDLVEVARIQKLLDRDDDFLLGWFTTREIGRLGNRAGQGHVVAGRVAAKEATAKALGTGFAGDVSWQDVEVLSNDSAAPTVELSGGALGVAQAMGIRQFIVSISNERSFAVASVIAVGGTTPSQGT